MKRNIKASLIILGSVSITCAVLGLIYNMASLWASFAGVFEKPHKEENLIYFYPSFYAMSAICVVFYLLLLLCGVYFIRLKIHFTRFFIATLLCEVLYLFLLGFISMGFIYWNLNDVFFSIAAATGAANGGLMAQFFILFPLWGIVLALWIRNKIKNEQRNKDAFNTKIEATGNNLGGFLKAG